MICGNDSKENIFVNCESNRCSVSENIEMLKKQYLRRDDDVTPRNKWKKGVIGELMNGSVGKVGGATLRVCTKDIKINLIKKDVNRLIPLELHLHEMGTCD